MEDREPGLLQQIIEVVPSLHSGGSFSGRVLRAIARHGGLKPVLSSVETGSGASTLLLSHVNENHTVFALDHGNGSIDNVKASTLLRKETVKFIEGPTQQTLPRHSFGQKLQLLLLDGPHAYPYPELEYYFLYPHLESGALLILDDIHIPTVQNLFRFLRCDEMFDLQEVVQTTGFFRRTGAPTFDPLGDGWSNQNYNKRMLLRYSWKSQLNGLLPEGFRRMTTRALVGAQTRKRCRVMIRQPLRHQSVDQDGTVEGVAKFVGEALIWVLARRRGTNG